MPVKNPKGTLETQVIDLDLADLEAVALPEVPGSNVIGVEMTNAGLPSVKVSITWAKSS
jgi:hypothetical protein